MGSRGVTGYQILGGQLVKRRAALGGFYSTKNWVGNCPLPTRQLRPWDRIQAMFLNLFYFNLCYLEYGAVNFITFFLLIVVSKFETLFDHTLDFFFFQAKYCASWAHILSLI